MKNDSNKDKSQDVPSAKRVLGNISPGPVDSELEQAPEALPKVQPHSEPAKAQPHSEPSKGLGSLRKGKGKAPSPSELPAEVPGSHRYGPPVTPVPAVPLTPPAPGIGDDRLVLPDGALVAMRRSGGFRFSSREVVIYHDGRVAVDSDAEGPTEPVITRRLSYKELAELYSALDAANSTQLPTTRGYQNADAYAYEIVTRSGTAVHSIEVFDGSIPAQLAPLIRFLTACIRPGQ